MSLSYDTNERSNTRLLCQIEFSKPYVIIIKSFDQKLQIVDFVRCAPPPKQLTDVWWWHLVEQAVGETSMTMEEVIATDPAKWRGWEKRLQKALRRTEYSEHYPHLPLLVFSLARLVTSKPCSQRPVNLHLLVVSYHSPVLQPCCSNLWRLPHALIPFLNSFISTRSSTLFRSIFFRYGCSTSGHSGAGPRYPPSIYTADQQKSLFDKAVKQADYEYTQAQCEGTARLNVIATRPPVSTPTPQAPAMREDDDYIA